MALPAPALAHICDVQVTIGKPLEIGETSMGGRRLIPITGGTVSGPCLQGVVLPAGADFQLLLDQGTQSHLEARYVLELTDGTLVWVHNMALRVTSVEDGQKIVRGEPVDPRQVYFRCQPRFEVAQEATAWHWLMTHQFIGTGVREPDCVKLSFFKVCLSA